MNTLKIVIVAAAFSIAVVGFVHLHRSNAQLKQEIADLIRGVDALRGEQGRAANAHRQDINEITALRAEVAALRTKQEQVAPVAQLRIEPQTDPQPALMLATGLRPTSELKNAGKATPEDCFETRLWAHLGGDIGMIVDTMVLPPETRQKAEELFAGLSDEARIRFGSPEELLANIFSGITGPETAGVQVLSREVGVRVDGTPAELRHDPRYATLRVQSQDTKGVVRETHSVFQQTADGWRGVIFPNTVIKAGHVLRIQK